LAYVLDHPMIYTDIIGGLGYYRRAKSLLEGAKTVMGDDKYKGKMVP
jgi:adenine-specific DNA glycosylase